jgi:crotonobetainyl-CoA:carnitine CoA-transferase CaiB-like acyl-CoA transferase
MTATDPLQELLGQLCLPPERAAEVSFENADPVLGTRLRVGDASAAAIAAVGLLICDLWKLRGGGAQKARVDVRAAAASLLSFAYQRIEGPALPPIDERTRLTDFYRTRDDSWLLMHNSFPKTTEATLELLGCCAEKDAVAAAIAKWDASELEDVMAERGLCGARVRGADEWRNSPQGRALAPLPTVEVLRVADSEPEALPEAARPLSGIRVLDLTRVLAGPTSGRTLAEHGAEVLRIASPELPSVPPFVVDTSHGKRSAFLDLQQPEQRERLRSLVREADVFTQGYRLGSLERLGFGVEELHALRPGLIYSSINCYGHEGPWRGRPGWEQLAQTVTGLALAHGGDRPVLLPAAATDYTTGNLSALGILVALTRRAREGGSYHVRVSLCQTGMWIDSLGRCDAPGAGIAPEELPALQCQSETPFGTVTHLAPVLQLSETSPHWALPSVPLGTHEASWL